MNSVINIVKKLMGGGKSSPLIAGKTLPLFNSNYSKAIANRKAVA